MTVNHLYLYIKINYSCGHVDQRGMAPADCWNWGKWGLKEQKRKGSFRGWFVSNRLGSSCWYKRLLSYLGCSGQRSTKYFFPHRTLFQFMRPPSNLGRQSCRAAYLWMCVSGCESAPSKEVKTNGKLDIRERTTNYHYVALRVDQLMDVGKRGNVC